MQASHGSLGVPSPELVYTRERVLYAVMIAVSLLLYGVLLLGALSNAEFAAAAIGYGLLFGVVGFLARGLGLGRLRGNAILVSERQFPLLYRLVQEHARHIGLREVPTVYVVESGGLLNAFATRFLGRDFVVVHSDVLELATAQGKKALSFIVGHELGHVWRGHLKLRWLIAPARLVPYLGAAYSRACEYTCDRVGAYCEPEGAISGLAVLAAGKQLHPAVNVAEFAAQAETDRGFWVRRAELISPHPRLPKRVAALLQLGVSVSETGEAAAAAPVAA